MVDKSSLFTIRVLYRVIEVIMGTSTESYTI